MFRNILANHKKKLLISSSLAYAGYFAYEEAYCKVYRRIKGMEKLEKNFVATIERQGTISGMVSQVSASNRPIASVYPESNKEICRLINYCHKYNFRLLVSDSKEGLLPGDYTGVIMVHLDRM